MYILLLYNFCFVQANDYDDDDDDIYTIMQKISQVKFYNEGLAILIQVFKTGRLKKANLLCIFGNNE